MLRIACAAAVVAARSVSSSSSRYYMHPKFRLKSKDLSWHFSLEWLTRAEFVVLIDLRAKVP